MSNVFDNPTDQVEADILVAGASITKDFPAIKIEVEKKVNDIPKATIEIIDGDPAKGDDGFKSANRTTTTTRERAFHNLFGAAYVWR